MFAWARRIRIRRLKHNYPHRWRTVFYYDQGKFKVLDVATSANFSDHEVAAVCDPILLKTAECDSCTDRFTKVWCRRLRSQNPAVRRRAWRSMSNMAAAFRVTSSKCERKHLLGQSLKYKRSRGRAISVKKLGLKTYQASVTKYAERMRSFVKKSVMGDSVAQRVFSQRLRSRNLMRHSRSNVQTTRGRRKKITTMLRPSRKRPCCGWDIFRAEKQHNVKFNPAALSQQNAEVASKWVNMYTVVQLWNHFMHHTPLLPF